MLYNQTMMTNNIPFIGATLQYDNLSNFGPFQLVGEDVPADPVSAETFEWEDLPDSLGENNAQETTMVNDNNNGSNNKKDLVVAPDSSAVLSCKLAMVGELEKKPTKPKPKRNRKPSPPKKLTPLPKDFQPSKYSVLCGKGNDNYHAIGNRRFRLTVRMFLERYMKASGRQEKSEIVRTVMDILQEACPVGAFVTQKDGRWYTVDERTAREKVGAFFRDSLHHHYKSSAKSKVARRKHGRRASTDTHKTSSSNGGSSTSDSSATSWL